MLLKNALLWKDGTFYFSKNFFYRCLDGICNSKISVFHCNSTKFFMMKIIPKLLSIGRFRKRLLKKCLHTIFHSGFLTNQPILYFFKKFFTTFIVNQNKGNTLIITESRCCFFNAPIISNRYIPWMLYRFIRTLIATRP